MKMSKGLFNLVESAIVELASQPEMVFYAKGVYSGKQWKDYTIRMVWDMFFIANRSANGAIYDKVSNEKLLDSHIQTALLKIKGRNQVVADIIRKGAGIDDTITNTPAEKKIPLPKGPKNKDGSMIIEILVKKEDTSQKVITVYCTPTEDGNKITVITNDKNPTKDHIVFSEIYKN